MRQVVISATALALFTVISTAYCAFANVPQTHHRVIFASINDEQVQTLSEDMKNKIDMETEREMALEIEIESTAGELPAIEIATVEFVDEGWEEPSQGVQGNPDGLNSYVGVVEYDGHVETAYSSNVAYHHRTEEWTPDEQGFYRTDEGYYVVASSDYEQGTLIETSQGTAMVLDDGCSNGVVDFYTNW